MKLGVAHAPIKGRFRERNGGSSFFLLRPWLRSVPGWRALQKAPLASNGPSLVETLCYSEHPTLLPRDSLAGSLCCSQPASVTGEGERRELLVTAAELWRASSDWHGPSASVSFPLRFVTMVSILLRLWPTAVVASLRGIRNREK